VETVKCNLCGSENCRVIYSMPDAHYFVDEWFSVVECTNCGLGFVNPRPTRSEISRYYPSCFYDDFDKKRDYHLRRYSAQAQFLPAIGSGDQRILLDLGCANGDFPRFMQNRGWKVEGVEVSENSKKITDFKVYKQEFEKIAVFEPHYDAITAWAVLEHVHDPMAYFKKASQVLKAGGAFVFLVTNFRSISSRFLFLEDIPRHLYFFTKETVEQYLANCNLHLVQTDYSNKIYSMRPVNFLRYYLYCLLKRRRLEWRDTQFISDFLQRNNSQHSLIRALNCSIFNPLYVVDRILMPIYERYQMIFKKYGIVTYVARKR
jgi:2-polyprenyl-3-methyl-5-hydroxy-6-metoxy-1,4-benzoquinol methylase